MKAWVSVDDGSGLTAAEAELVGRCSDAVKELDGVVRSAAGTVALMRDALAGQPRSGLGRDAAGGAPPWCWAHSRPTVHCDRQGLLCRGENLAVADPTGEAAISGDTAAEDLRMFVKRLKQLDVLVRELVARSAAYPGAAIEDQSVTPSAGDGWCQSCWRDDKLMREVARNSAGAIRYRGLCRRCGEWRSKLGGKGMPPLWLVRRLNRKLPVTPGMVQQARAEMRSKKSRRSS